MRAPCGCGASPAVSERDVVWNDAGQSTLDYRIGTYPTFRTSMLLELANKDSLRDLTTRSEDDATVSLVSAWAATLDVLTFYQERVANEAFLRTATERRSVLELANCIGYQLNPGVAASTFLAFTVDEAPGAPAEVRVDVGTRVQSQPEQDETPQTYETIEQIIARREFNAIPAKSRQRVIPRFGARRVTLQGRSTGLKPGDAILIVGDEREQDAGAERWDFRRVSRIEVDDDHDLTTVFWQEGLGAYRGGRLSRPAESDVRVFALKTRANLFGYNAPSLVAMIRVAKATNPNATSLPETEWPNLNISYADSIPDGLNRIHLDAAYPQILEGSWIALSKPGTSARNAGYVEAYRVREAVEDSITAFTMSGRTTRLELEGENLVEEFGSALRTTQVFGESIELAIAAQVIEEPVEGFIIDLDAHYPGLEADRWVGVTGTLVQGGSFSGSFQIADVITSEDVTRLELTTSLPPLVRESVRVNANVAASTHGESTAESLGAGNNSVPNQAFLLKKSPLTYVASNSASGQASTLVIRVNDIRWTEVPTLYGTKPTDRIYTLRRSDDGLTTVKFGNGERGSRLPTGVENIQATYRTGIGKAGIVRANQIKLLLSRPLGLRGATNPSVPESAADPETLESARQNAPRQVLTLDRIVSVRDFESFAAAFAGVAKAQASPVWTGEDRIVHLTVAGEDGSAVAASSTLGRRLIQAIDQARHADRRVTTTTFEPLPFSVDAMVLPDPAWDRDKVLLAAHDQLVAAFSFAEMNLAESVALSDVLAALQSTPGVVAAQVTALWHVGQSKARRERLIARRARLEGGTIRAAQLLSLTTDSVTITEMTA